MTEPQAHDYGSMPFGAHDLADQRAAEAAEIERQEQEMRKALANAVLRLMRPEVGASEADADWMLGEIGAADVNAFRDADLKAKVDELRAAREAADTPDGVEDPAGFDITGTIDSLVAYVNGDPVKAAAVAEAEHGQDKPRKTLLKHLDELSAPAEDGLGNSTDVGAEDKQQGDGVEDPADS